MKYLVLGSCVTRDAFENSDAFGIELFGYHARSSFATLSDDNFLKKVTQENLDLLEGISSPFRRRMVKNDFNNTVLKAVLEEGFDKVIIDLIDERFHLAVIDNKFVTRSTEFLASEIKVKSSINTFSDRYFELWCQGFDNFIRTYEKNNRLEDLIVNQVYWATHSSDDKPLDQDKFPIDLTSKHNLKLDRMYSYMNRVIPSENFLKFNDELLKVDQDHKWGVSPFHYIDRYYDTVLSMLESKHS
ncbi:MAG: hypothetical protein ACI9ST_000349 [Psychrobacter glaciei]|jgi:hypothetical protein|uniref:DUF6270 domain-containing protein n=1 Tax=Psychrobacter glaciei TaxID=619771 RepID=UPI0039E2549F